MKKKVLIILSITLIGISSFINLDKKSSFRSLTFECVEALAEDGEGTIELDNYKPLPEKNTPCTVQTGDKIEHGIWVSCVSGDETCFSGCQVENK